MTYEDLNELVLEVADLMGQKGAGVVVDVYGLNDVLTAFLSSHGVVFTDEGEASSS